ncbi:MULTISPECIES: hypothetical protein [Haloarcula]|uniref:hypothetical protein n=1 Tax=Haloarcula TaxID=2237 RepID=UPI0023E8A714|nr:hypothetical protein [Halomicroarcula sp. SHR3]
MALLEALQREVGDNLRAVATYEEKEWELVYERDDIKAKPRIFDKIHEELILEGMGTEYLEDVFDVGRLDCTMHSFEEAMCFHFVRGSMRGVFISIEPDALLPLGEFVEICTENEIET